MEITREFNRYSSPCDIASIVCSVIDQQHEFDQAKEQFFAFGLDPNRNIKYGDLVSMGTLNRVRIHPRESFRHAVAQGVDSIVFAHNHPGGGLEPSERDLSITKQLVLSGQILGIKVIDHIIVGDVASEYLSLRDSPYWEQHWNT